MIRISIRKSCLLAIGCLPFLVSAIAHGADYDPLAVPAQVTPRIVDLTLKALERQRDISIQICLPQAPCKSHWLYDANGPTRDKSLASRYYAQRWRFR